MISTRSSGAIAAPIRVVKACGRNVMVDVHIPQRFQEGPKRSSLMIDVFGGGSPVKPSSPISSMTTKRARMTYTTAYTYLFQLDSYMSV